MCMGGLRRSLCTSVYTAEHVAIDYLFLLPGMGRPNVIVVVIQACLFEVTGNSGFFKIVHCGTFVAVMSLNSFSSCVFGNTVSSIHRMKWTWPTHILMMAQSLDVSVSSLMVIGLVMSVAVAEACFLTST
jgi:hypothetical protein